MNRQEEYQYLMQEDLTAKERFYRFAEMAGITNKERPETWHGFLKYKKYIRPDSMVAEIGAGHGLLGSFLGWLGIARVKLIDSRYIEKECIALKTAIRFKPHIANYVKSIGKTLTAGDYTDFDGVDSICGIHLCGDLTDFALRAAVEKRIPVAVMTCCHNKKMTGSPRCGVNLNLQALDLQGRMAIDIGRASWLVSQGYKVRMSKIPPGISGEPTVLLAVPIN